MVEIGKIRIRKKIYNFDVRGRYQYKRHYTVKQKPPLEKIKEKLKELVTPPKKKVHRRRLLKKPKEAPPGGFNFAIIGAALLVALLILGIGWMHISAILELPLQPGVQTPVLSPALEASVIGGGIYTIGDRGSNEYVAGVMLDYAAENVENLSIALTTYKEKLPSQVFVLKGEKVDASSYPDFISSLRSRLSKKKILINEMTESQLETLPEGAVVVVPTGYAPKSILGVGTDLSMDKLVERGVVIVYIGHQFTQMLDGSLPVPTPSEVTKGLPVRFFGGVALESEEGFNLFQPLYLASPGSGWKGTTVYGSVSIITKDDGAFVFLPQTLDGGWRGNGTAAAEDVSRIIFEMPWVEPDGEARTYLLTNETGLSGRGFFFSSPFEIREFTSMKIDLTGSSSSAIRPIEEVLIYNVGKEARGELYIKGGHKVVPTNITNAEARFSAKLQEETPGQPQMFLVITDTGGDELQNFPRGNVNVQGEVSADIPVYVDKGEYIVSMIDDESKVYAQGYMKVVSIDINYKGSSLQRPSVYSFDVTMDDASISVQELTLKIDDGKFGTYSFRDVSRMDVDVSRYTGGDALPYGEHTFEFSAGGLKKIIDVSRYPPRSFFNEPVFWFSIILSILIVGVGMFFARQEEIYFSIDIPDFPLVSRTKISLPPDTILGIFEKVNENYRWKNTPLNSTEIKNGFKDVYYKGKPIIISDYNVDFILDDLEKKRKVVGSMNYYGLLEWEKETGHSMDYLAMMRLLRDICVNNAIPFTSLGESKLADSEVDVVGQQMFLHFYEKTGDAEEFMKSIFRTIQKGISIVLFKNEIQKRNFVSVLNSPSQAAVLLKMEYESGSVLLLTMKEMEDMLKELKTY